jgi:hypothetical protein
VLHAVDGGSRRGDRQRRRRLLGQHAGHGTLRRGAGRHGELHRDLAYEWAQSACGSTPSPGWTCRHAHLSQCGRTSRCCRSRCGGSAPSPGLGGDAFLPRPPPRSSPVRCRVDGAPTARLASPLSALLPGAEENARETRCTWPLLPHERSQPWNGFHLAGPSKLFADE